MPAWRPKRSGVPCHFQSCDPPVEATSVDRVTTLAVRNVASSEGALRPWAYRPRGDWSGPSNSTLAITCRLPDRLTARSVYEASTSPLGHGRHRPDDGFRRPGGAERDAGAG